MSETARPALVRFETRAIEDRAKSEKEGHAVYRDVNYAIVTPMGSANLVVEREAEDFIKSKEKDEFHDFYKKAYAAFLEGLEAPVDGTAIENWPAVTPAQVKNIRASGLRTVEDLAAAPEPALQRMGMGARALKDKAANWLKAAKDNGQMAERMSALEVRLKDVEARNEDLEKANEDLKRELAGDKVVPLKKKKAAAK